MRFSTINHLFWGYPGIPSLGNLHISHILDGRDPQDLGSPPPRRVGWLGWGSWGSWWQVATPKTGNWDLQKCWKIVGKDKLQKLKIVISTCKMGKEGITNLITIKTITQIVEKCYFSGTPGYGNGSGNTGSTSKTLWKPRALFGFIDSVWNRIRSLQEHREHGQVQVKWFE